MGYYSDFQIFVDGVTDEDALDEIAERLGVVADGYTFETYGDGVLHSSDRFKWYDHEKDLARLSESYPDTLFEMRVFGEESDTYQVYAKNGKVYSQNIEPVWPEFDEARLS